MILNTLLRKCYCFILDGCAGTSLIPSHGKEYILEGQIYDYKLVVGKSITQKEKPGVGSRSWLIGNYASGTNDTEFYDNGQGCGGEIKRQATITFVKGEETKVLEENEPSTCNYEYIFQINCKPGKIFNNNSVKRHFHKLSCLTKII